MTRLPAPVMVTVLPETVADAVLVESMVKITALPEAPPVAVREMVSHEE